jgi:hypothetical protein
MPAPLDRPDAARYLERLVDRSRAVLGDRLIGAWLANSGARDDYLPGRSDLDVELGVDGALDEPSRFRLADALRHGSLPCPAPRLELVVYRSEVLADPGARPDWELNLNTGPATADHVGLDASAEPTHWFVLDLSMARERSIPLLGPPLADLLAPIPDELVIEALRASADWHAVNDAAAPNRVLNACRAWLWLTERRWSSKTEAAAWAIAAGGDASLIELALARRRGESVAPLPVDRIGALAGLVARHLDGSDPPSARGGAGGR